MSPYRQLDQENCFDHSVDAKSFGNIWTSTQTTIDDISGVNDIRRYAVDCLKMRHEHV